MRLLERLSAVVARLGEFLASLATLACLALISLSVIARYGFGAPQPWIDKTAGWLVLALVMLGAAEAQRRFEHIGVDVAQKSLGPFFFRLSRLIGAVSVAATAYLLLQSGIETVAFSQMIGLVTEVGNIPTWWVQVLLPIGAVLLLVVSVVQAIVLIGGRLPEYTPTGDEELPRDTLARGE
ncbi:TRAP transporter small permease [Acetobacteraceae bacterium H6797]|nr:TRAP transporter small permease [Acetobacteraceae bacterium H6797]